MSTPIKPPQAMRCEHCGTKMPLSDSAYDVLNDRRICRFSHPNEGFVQSGRIPCFYRGQTIKAELLIGYPYGYDLRLMEAA